MSIRTQNAPRLNPAKFQHAEVTLKGERRASVALRELTTLWVNTGTLCNITCANCYIESSPRNDALVYITAAEVREYLEEDAARPVREVGFTGGEPFMNPGLVPMLDDVLSRGKRALVLTNAMQPMRRYAEPLKALLSKHGGARLIIRVSLDHFDGAIHDLERGVGSYARTIAGLEWLARAGFTLHVAGRVGFGHDGEAALRAGYAALFAAHAIPVDANDPVALMLFPEMDADRDVPEITEGCWDILKLSPDSLMCASARMVVKRKGAARPAVLACTLLAHDERFELGATLAEAARPVALNHPHCASFCVLGGASCSR